ncbi:MAG: hypothetical protein B7Z37_16945 [Verrucomicrobia bacterium 12-59-8]|nr:MAG: hypothetical protein B7Z37_16945 [Verrucomicrobia bacterium 12-59-8]
MSKPLYVYLKGGRGDAHVTDLWDGAEPGEEGTFNNASGEMSAEGLEVGDPYRDIHNYSTSVLNALAASGLTTAGGVTLLNGTALVAASTTPTLLTGLLDANNLPLGGTHASNEPGLHVGPVGSAGPVVMELGNITPHVSDEVANAKPRLFTKVCTWLIFKEVGEAATYKFRKADVLGWGANPRSE